MNLRKLFDQMVSEPQRMLDSGALFQRGFYNIVRLISILVGLYGAYLIVSELFGGNGYIDKMTDLPAFPMVRSIFCSLITLLISVATIAWMTGILWNRSRNFKEIENGSVIDILPRFIRLIGETLAVLPLSAALISFIAILLAAYPYAPIEAFYDVSKDFEFVDGMVGKIENGVRIDEFDDYIDGLSNGLLGLVLGIIYSFTILVIYYLIAQVWEILVRFFRRQTQA